MSNEQQPEVIEVEPVDPSSSMSVVEALNRAEVDVQITTAKRFPRSIRKFLDEARDMACLNEEIASACIYALPRGNKSIEGPSARLAEIVLSAWGNCAGAARIIEEGDRFVTAQGAFRDYERNTGVTFEVRRRITTKQGERFGDDMITVTANAACSIAFRNAIFKGVPKAFWGPIYDAARKTAIGDASTLANRRAQMFEYFQKMGVTADQVLAVLEKKGIEDIGGDDLLMLKGLANAIKDGDATVDQAFVSPLASAPTGRGSLKPEAKPETKPKPPVEEQWIDDGVSTRPKPQTKPATTEPKPNVKTQEQKPQTTQPPKEEAKSSAEPSGAETKGGASDAPVTAEARHQFLARIAMKAAGWDDEQIAMKVTRKWLLVNQIGPSSLNKDAIFNPTRAQVESLDWKPMFDEYANAAAAASKGKQ